MNIQNVSWIRLYNGQPAACTTGCKVLEFLHPVVQTAAKCKRTLTDSSRRGRSRTSRLGLCRTKWFGHGLVVSFSGMRDR